MKIDDSSKKSPGISIGTTPARSGKVAEKAGPEAKPAGSVHISSQLQTISGQLSNGVFDAGKVDEIKAAISSGQFQVNAEKVAEGLIDSVRDLIQSRKG